VSAQRRIHAEASLVVGTHGPLPVAEAVRALRRQPDLRAAAKLSLTPRGAAELVAEIGDGAPRGLAEQLVGDALDRALDWLAGEETAAGAADALPAEALETALAEAARAEGFDWAPQADGGYRVRHPSLDAGARLHVHALAGGARVSSQTTLAAPGEAAPLALACFALETNRRLRLARLSVRPEGERAITLVWDAVLPAGASLDVGLAERLVAVAATRARTRRAAAALLHGAVSDAYLRSRERFPSA